MTSVECSCQGPPCLACRGNSSCKLFSHINFRLWSKQRTCQLAVTTTTTALRDPAPCSSEGGVRCPTAIAMACRPTDTQGRTQSGCAGQSRSGRAREEDAVSVYRYDGKP